MVTFNPFKQPSIPELVNGKAWGALRKVLSNPERVQKKLQNCEPKDALTVLHKACSLNPPLDVIKLLNKAVPGLNTHPDENGRYPVHVAAEWGASHSVIEYLVNKDPVVASFQDKNGKTPLHCFCELYAKNFPSWERSKLEESMIKVIKVLSMAAPMSLVMEDFEELNVVEYAIQSGMKTKSLRTLQRECTYFYRKKQKTGVTHANVWDELRRDMRVHKTISKRHLLAANDAMVTQFSGRHHKEETKQQSFVPNRAVAA